MSSCHLPGEDPGPTVSASWKAPWPWHFTQVRKFDAREAADWPQITQGESARSGSLSASPAPVETEGCQRPRSAVTSKVTPQHLACSPRAPWGKGRAALPESEHTEALSLCKHVVPLMIAD